MNQPRPWLKYVEAGDLDGDAEHFDGMNVESPTGEYLGDVDGFIVDAESGRPYYVVVESGGWFKTRHFLMPVGHVRLDTADGDEALVADLTRDRVEQFPGFDTDEFDKLSEAELKRMNDAICVACSDGTIAYPADEPYAAAWDRPAYRYPDWWSTLPSRPDRMGESALTSGVDLRRDDTLGEARETAADYQRGTRAATDESPHFAGRAQPGDVIGIETAGERTYVGDTAEDEDRRREEAQSSAAKEPEPRR